MIEISRYILATMVAQTHLWPLGAAWTGNIAVFAFYTLSGYLMTRVLNERYGFTPRGTVAFLLNRVLRLWPAYLAILGLTLIALLFLPLSNFFFLIRMPTTLADIVTNLAILGQVTFDFKQWLPLAKPVVTSWSLSIELFSYLLLALYFARSSVRLWAFAMIGAVAMGFSTWHCAVSAEPAAYGPYCAQNRYGVLQAGFLPFAMGGLFYFHQDTLSVWIKANWRVLIVVLIGAHAAMFLGDALSATIGPYLGIGVIICLLSVWPGGIASGAQDFFGRASYHLFLAHMPIAAVLVTGLGLRPDSVSVFCATMVVALALSLGLVPMERTINLFRERISRSVTRASAVGRSPSLAPVSPLLPAAPKPSAPGPQQVKPRPPAARGKARRSPGSAS
jgi:peptidoglycan/LPS O-acetylase OafA/YrhL